MNIINSRDSTNRKDPGNSRGNSGYVVNSEDPTTAKKPKKSRTIL
jgi:hypothetical protein